MTKIRLTEYELNRCGYYGRNGDWLAGGFTELVSDLNEWLPGRPLAHARTFVSSGSDGAAMDVFAAGWAFDTNKSLGCLVLWCAVSSVEGDVLSIDPSSTVGTRISPHRNSIRPGEVPGYPAYFLLDAKKGRYFTLRIESGPVAPKQMYLFCEGFLEHYGSRVESDHDENITEITVTGFHVDSSGTPRTDVRPKFAAHPRREASSLAYLKRNAHKIFKVERKLKLGAMPRAEGSSFLRSALRWMGLPAKEDAVDHAANFRYSMLVSVDSIEVEAMIGSLTQNDDDSWSDLGFYFRGRPNPVWARKALRAGDIEIDIDGSRNTWILDPAEVLQKVSQHMPR